MHLYARDELLLLRSFHTSLLHCGAAPADIARDTTLALYLSRHGAPGGAFPSPPPPPPAATARLSAPIAVLEASDFLACAPPSSRGGLDAYERALMAGDWEGGEGAEEVEEAEEGAHAGEAECAPAAAAEAYVGPLLPPAGAGKRARSVSGEAPLQMPPAPPPPELWAFALAWWQWGLAGRAFPS
jgi:hypothetical protein